ncbi:hypothetical protein V2J09_009210 [Rumex salicifolius]
MAHIISLPPSLHLPPAILFLSVPSALPLAIKANPKPNFHRLKLNSVLSNSYQSNSDPQNKVPPPPANPTLFPGGYKRPEIKVPGIVLQLTADEVLADGSVLDVVDGAVSKWVGIVVLEEGGDGTGGGGKLYKAACLLKSVIKDRAYLLISERVDIASAINASGVVLSDQGLPAIVARNTMSDAKSESVFLPMVGRSIQSLDAAFGASNSEGADFLIYSADIEDLNDSVISSMYKNVKIPIFVATALNRASTVLRSGASGLLIKLEEYKLFSPETFNQLLFATPKDDPRSQDKLQSLNKPQALDGVAGFVNLDERKVNFVKKERRILHEAIEGEFNSGKSSVVNALLGGRFLEEGVVPTTNEITFLRYSEVDSGGTQRCERHPDGQYICYLPAEILKEMVIVDTPGTNVILQRQQRLTEEFVPRADMLLFVLSADRPLTESEVTFLRYTQQWKKKIVFVLNKADLYQNSIQLEEATKFVKENVQRLLNTEHVMLYPVSARSALEAKLSTPNFGRGYAEVATTGLNVTSNFDEFEKFLCNLLDGSTDAGKERMRMKFGTPIGIAERLLSACQTLITQEIRCAKQDLNSVEGLISSVKEYANKMDIDSMPWRRQILSLVDSTQRRTLKLVESTLQLSNLDVAVSFLLKGEKSYSVPATRSIQNDILGPAISDAQRLLGEYSNWLQENNIREGRQFKETFEKKWSSFIEPDLKVNPASSRLPTEVDVLSIKAIQNFKADDASKLFDQEVREVFLGAFGGIGAAGLSASLLTSVLPTTLEDLLALGLCSAGGLLAVSNFPARRQKTVDKVKSISSAVRSQVEEAMAKDVGEAVKAMELYVQAIGRPYKKAAQGRLEKLMGIQDELTSVEKQLQSLQIELQNIHLS